ncbi:MAG TPA: hypothetical protein VGG75_16055 [Trebonia sp.]
MSAPDEEDLNASLRRLLDAGYSVQVSRWDAESLPAGADYFAEITSGMGSTWRGFGETPADAIRGCWPLGQGNGKGGCGHCGGLGCETAECKVCAAYTDAPGNGVCAVCGDGYPVEDGDEDLDDEGDTDDFDEDETFGEPVGPDTPCRASSQAGTACTVLGLHFEHDDGNGLTWAAM